MTSVHTSVFIVSLSKWSFTFKMIPGVPLRIDLILLVLICRVTPNNYKVVGTDTYSTSHQPYICIPRIMKTNTRLYSVLNCTVHVSVCRRFVCQRFWSVDVLISQRFGLVWFVDVLVCRRFWSVDVSVCRRFGLLMFWYVDVLVCRRFSLSTFLVGRCFDISTFWFGLVCRRVGLSTFWSVDVSVCRRFGLLMFWYVDVLVCRRFSLSTFWSVDISVSQCFGLSTFWLSTFRFLDVFTSYLQKGPLWHTKSCLKNMVIILQSTYQNGFFQWHFS